MAHPKPGTGTLDMGRAWTQATGMIAANRDMISAMAGLFFFLPALASALLVPEMTSSATIPPSGAAGDQQAQMDAMTRQVFAFLAANWPLLLVTLIAQFAGTLSLFALLSDRGNPTVGEAMATGLKSLPTYLVAQLLSGLGSGLALGLPLALVGLLGIPAAGLLAAFAVLAASIYLMTRFALIAPVIAVEQQRNPIAAITRSWQLTDGNGGRILVFIALLMVTIVIIATLVTATLTLLLSALGGAAASIGAGVVNALANTIVSVILLAVIAAIHRQLAEPAGVQLTKTFE